MGQRRGRTHCLRSYPPFSALPLNCTLTLRLGLERLSSFPNRYVSTVEIPSLSVLSWATLVCERLREQMADQGQTDPSNNRCSATREGTSGDVVIEIGHTMAEQKDDQPTAEAIELRRRAVHSSQGTTSSSGITITDE